MNNLLRDDERRELSFLNTKNDDVYTDEYDGSVHDIIQISLFVCLGICFIFETYYIVKLSSLTVKELYTWKSIRIVMPFISIFMCIECITLAVDTYILKIANGWSIILYMMEACIAPSILLYTFDITYIAYRIRSMPFCFVRRHFDQTEQKQQKQQQEKRLSQRQQQSETLADDEQPKIEYTMSKNEPLVRPKTLLIGMRIFAFLLLLLSLFVNYDVVGRNNQQQSTNNDELAGRTGWVSVFQIGSWSDPSSAGGMIHVILGLIPMLIVSCSCFYFAILLWRYGNELSMTIYTSVLNPWIYPLFGVLALFVGQFPVYPWFAISSNTGILLYQLSMIRTLIEIKQDLGQESELGSYLGALCWNEPTDLATITNQSSQDDKEMNENNNNRSGVLRPSSTKNEQIDNAELLASTIT